ncbi:hypothetical protein IMZ48_06205 [Candidatus Bathyarchaeota archaeon]|nr:hypothetical protein [Candidatus Bathyarchaeota archaeon]
MSWKVQAPTRQEKGMWGAYLVQPCLMDDPHRRTYQDYRSVLYYADFVRIGLTRYMTLEVLV